MVLWLAVVSGCSPTDAPSASAPSAAPAPLQGEAAEIPKKTGEHARPDRPAAAPVVSPEVHLIRTSGSARGPIPYLTVEPSEAPNETPIVIVLHGRGARAERATLCIVREGKLECVRMLLEWGADKDFTVKVRALSPVARPGGRDASPSHASGSPPPITRRTAPPR